MQMSQQSFQTQKQDGMTVFDDTPKSQPRISSFVDQQTNINKRKQSIKIKEKMELLYLMMIILDTAVMKKKTNIYVTLLLSVSRHIILRVPSTLTLFFTSCSTNLGRIATRCMLAGSSEGNGRNYFFFSSIQSFLGLAIL